MKCLFMLLLALLVVAIPVAAAQVQYGSVGVVYYTDEKVIVAADSRGSWSQENASADDSACKIATPKRQLVFVSTNAAGYRDDSDPTVAPWTNIEEIRRAAEFYPNSRGHLSEIADIWGRDIALHFESLYLRHPELVIEARARGNGVLTVAITGGLDAIGNLVLFQTVVTFDESKLQPIAFLTKGINCPRHSYCSIGENEIVKEFVDQSSNRAKAEAKVWKPPKGSAPTDRDILRVMRLVDLTVKYHVGNDVGGAVDAVQLNKDGSLCWFALKKNCRGD
jgi:hypothetical protein